MHSRDLTHETTDYPVFGRVMKRSWTLDRRPWVMMAVSVGLDRGRWVQWRDVRQIYVTILRFSRNKKRADPSDSRGTRWHPVSTDP